MLPAGMTLDGVSMWGTLGYELVVGFFTVLVCSLRVAGRVHHDEKTRPSLAALLRFSGLLCVVPFWATIHEAFLQFMIHGYIWFGVMSLKDAWKLASEGKIKLPEHLKKGGSGVRAWTSCFRTAKLDLKPSDRVIVPLDGMAMAWWLRRKYNRNQVFIMCLSVQLMLDFILNAAWKPRSSLLMYWPQAAIVNSDGISNDEIFGKLSVMKLNSFTYDMFDGTGNALGAHWLLNSTNKTSSINCVHLLLTALAHGMWIAHPVANRSSITVGAFGICYVTADERADLSGPTDQWLAMSKTSRRFVLLCKKGDELVPYPLEHLAVEHLTGATPCG